MEFGLNEDQEVFRATVRTFAREKLAPGSLERAKSERFPWDAYREVAGLGVFGLLAGEEFSPLDHEDYVAVGLVVEELAYADFNTANNNLSFLLRDYAEAVEMAAGDVAVAIAPANTGATGYLFPVLAPLLCGAASVLLENWTPAGALDLLEGEHATHAAAIPTQLVKMLQEEGIGRRDFSSVRVITSAGAPLTPDTAEQTENAFGCAVTTVYGSTDGGVITVTRTTDPVHKRRQTVGRPIPGAELVLRDPLGDPVPVGTSGEATWRTPTKSFGYLNDDERTEAMFRGDGWYYSGDLGTFDADGYLAITGRSKDLIIRGGQNISPLEIEQIIARHDAVSEVAVVGVPDPVFGERVCACVVLLSDRTGLTLDELVEYMWAQDIAPFKLPERLEVFNELPKTAGGKLSKVTVRSAVAERSAAR